MVQVAVVVISSKIFSGKSSDKGREELTQFLEHHDAKVVSYEVIPDERDQIKNRLCHLADQAEAQIILTVGGTGVRPTDWTPEATREVIDKEIPGIGEAMRFESLKKVRTAMLSRGIAGIRHTTLIINLPGSPKGAKDNLAVVWPILDHTVEKLSGSSNM